MADEYKTAVRRIADHVLSDARRLAGHLGTAIGAPESRVLADVLDLVHKLRPVSAQLERDKRATYWRARMRLYAPSGSLEADSDPELDPTAPGATVVRGLPGVAEWAGELVQYFHAGRGEKVAWLSNTEAHRKLRALRSTLSRKGGKTTWRVEYQVDSHPWKALIDIQREEE